MTEVNLYKAEVVRIHEDNPTSVNVPTAMGSIEDFARPLGPIEANCDHLEYKVRKFNFHGIPTFMAFDGLLSEYLDHKDKEYTWTIDRVRDEEAKKVFEARALIHKALAKANDKLHECGPEIRLTNREGVVEGRDLAPDGSRVQKPGPAAQQPLFATAIALPHQPRNQDLGHLVVSRL